MNTATTAIMADEDPGPPPATGLPVRHDLWLCAALALLVALAFAVGRAGWFKAGDDLGYGLGVVGGVLMLLLMLYPARKYLRVMRRSGGVKHWFWFHMICGIAGPWLILVHSTFRIGSLNAGVALISMVIVVLSGVVGRFLFVRVQHRLDGGQQQLQHRRNQVGLASNEARSMLSFAPDLQARLRAFEQRELTDEHGRGASLLQLLAVPLRHGLELRRCRRLLDQRLQARTAAEPAADEEAELRRRRAHRLLDRYFGAVLQVAHFSLFDRLFALWHVAHLPFVVLLVLSAVIHVVAVHAY